MDKKKIPNIYIRQYQKFDTKRTRKSFYIVLAVCFCLAAAYFSYQYRDLFWRSKPQQNIIITRKETLSLYYPAGSQTDKLTEKTIEIKTNLTDKEKGDIIIKNLKSLKAVPPSLTLQDLAIDSDGVLYLNLTKDIVAGKIASLIDISTTFSMVDSFLRSFRNASKVQFLVDGNPVYTLGGTVYTYKPLQFNQDILED